LHQTSHADALKPGRDFRKAKIPKVSSVRVPVAVVSVALKLCTIEELLQEQSCVSARRLRGKGHNPEKCVLGSSPGEDVFCTSVAKHDKKRN
jgi:hypothetical protein